MPRIERVEDGRLLSRFDAGPQPLTIGRGMDGEIYLPHPTVGRRHARVLYDAGVWYLEDLESRNGTYLNGRKLVGRAVLADGSLIQIGPERLVFRDDARDGRPEDHATITGGFVTSLSPGAELERVREQLNAILEDQQRRLDTLNRERKLAGEYLATLLPRKAPEVPGYRVRLHHRFAAEVGGDLYDVVTLRDGRTAFCLADAAGKGMRSALFATRALAEARHALTATDDLAAAVGALNETLVDPESACFVILLVAALDGPAGRVEFVGAGALSPLHYEGSAGRATFLPSEKTGYPLGIVADSTYESETLDLHPGDALVLCSDGFVDALGPEGPPFGPDRLLAAFELGPGQPADSGVDRLIAAVRAFEQGTTPREDQSLVLIERLEGPGAS